MIVFVCLRESKWVGIKSIYMLASQMVIIFLRLCKQRTRWVCVTIAIRNVTCVVRSGSL